mgnify:CR=1 FL=1
MQESVTEWFIECVRREQAALRAFVRRLGVRSESVDDVAQDALVIAFEKLASFDRSQEFGPWVRGIARRLVANRVRKDARREELLSRAVTEILLDHIEADTASDPLYADRLAALRHCLDILPEHSRRTLQWRYFEDLSSTSIAERLGRSANDVRQLIFRLRRTLLDCIETRLANPSTPGMT